MDVLSFLRSHRFTILHNIWKANIKTTSRALNLAYKIHGPSPPPHSIPILVLHGLLGSKKNWESICKKLTASTNSPVIAVDARNHGDSPHNNNHRYSDLASDVIELIDSFAVSQVHIIGHSMGGRTGMVVALTQPSKVASLIVVDISPVSTTIILNDFFPKLIDVMKSVNFEGAENLHKARIKAKDKIVESGIIDNHMEGMQFILMNIGKIDNNFGWKCNLDALQKNFNYIATFPDLAGKTYEGPTLFIGGSLSSHLPRDDLDGIKKYFPKAELMYVEGVGHNVHAEDPKTFFDTVMKFFGSI